MDLTIETRGLTRLYGKRRVVDDLRLEVPRGSVFGFLGQNGAGKTTTMRLLLGLIAPSAGEVLMFGKPLREDPLGLLARTGALVEGPGFYPYLSARRNLTLLARGTRRLDRPESAVDEALEAVELSDRADDRYGTYSRGMKQRLGIAWAILGRPELVLLDEPLNGLDPPAVLRIRGVIADLAKKGTTVFLSSHLLHEVEVGCDRVAIIDRGRLISQGSVKELLRPDHAVLEVETSDLALAAQTASNLPFVRAARTETTELGREALVVELEAGRAAELNRALVEKGLAVATVVPRRRTLEDLYHARVAESRRVPV
ncbi:MAG TPA: ATP-binding cassette domain-containing protein [Planctomycetota bacterium]|nr:ATP-binding cassette domain-containing protein [Planctomycetota bacterium]